MLQIKHLEFAHAAKDVRIRCIAPRSQNFTICETTAKLDTIGAWYQHSIQHADELEHPADFDTRLLKDCSICDEPVPTNQTGPHRLRRHMDIHYPSHHCQLPKCDEVILRDAGYVRHLKTKHGRVWKALDGNILEKCYCRVARLEDIEELEEDVEEEQVAEEARDDEQEDIEEEDVEDVDAAEDEEENIQDDPQYEEDAQEDEVSEDMAYAFQSWKHIPGVSV